MKIASVLVALAATRVRAAERVLVVLVTLLLPRWAAACPMCASQQPGGVARIVTLGVMMLLPFAITFIVVRALRRTARSS